MEDLEEPTPSKRPRLEDTAARDAADIAVPPDSTAIDADALFVFSENCAYLSNCTGWDGSSVLPSLCPERERFVDLHDVKEALDEPSLSECLVCAHTEADEESTDCEFMVDLIDESDEEEPNPTDLDPESAFDDLSEDELPSVLIS